MNRAIICDDHALMRDALAATVRNCMPGVTIVAVSNFVDCWAAAQTHADLCVCDLAMPGAKPHNGIATLLSIQPGLPVVVVSGSADIAEMKDIFALGVGGVITKVTDGAVVEAAIRLVLAGGRYVAPEIYERDELFDKPLLPPEVPQTQWLTKTQIEVIRHLVDGKTNKEIAKQLAIAPSTVNSHLDQIFKRLGAANRTDACQRYLAIQSNRAS